MIREEADFLLVSLLWGAGLTAAYDCFRIARTAVRHASWAVAIEDFIYWVFAGFALFYLLFTMNDGNVRWYALAGAASGMWLYHITLSPILVKIFGTIFQYIMKGLAFPAKTAGRLLKKWTKCLTMKISAVWKKRKQRLQEKKARREQAQKKKEDSALNEKDRGEKHGRKQKEKALQKTKQKGHSGDSPGGGPIRRRGDV
ncbi:spore cortex biosynthesis protein YabQ [Lacrimispora sp. NSJ-141]|uniref:Spore cortex biosynthesis protein YabQ n=1 Tax=Lientehia hominis TaxID=2897778 RepID=A0AAP2W9R6_9FIRM|nr:spore cortex biosynthesis protein YabQ [Lientehia hominis]MCD2492222.1 spore cortex biosynthesis protein YabQ [Lientehia hominis]